MLDIYEINAMSQCDGVYLVLGWWGVRLLDVLAKVTFECDAIPE